MDNIEKEFLSSAIVKGGLFLYNAQTAFLIIQRCKELKMKILGVDTFIVHNNKTQPISEHSIDYSSINKKINVWDSAKDFVLGKKNLNEKHLFEIIYEER